MNMHNYVDYVGEILGAQGVSTFTVNPQNYDVTYSTGDDPSIEVTEPKEYFMKRGFK
jgi:hypothetical protein